MGSLFLAIYQRLHPYLCGPDDRGRCGLGNDRSHRRPFLPFVAVDSFSTFLCHACINPCRQHPWSLVHRHGPLDYVRLSL
jgi:hypothetical protein